MNVKNFKILMPLAFCAVMASCIKDRNPLYTDFGNVAPFLECKNLVIRGGLPVDIAGLSGFDDAENYLQFSEGADSLTMYFYVNLASANTLDHDLNITVGPSADVLNAYNDDPNNLVKYEMLPDQYYNWTARNLTIPAGQRAVLDSLVIYLGTPIDGTKNYMLSAGIVDGDGIEISANKGAMYYHVIGNCIAVGPASATGTITYYVGSYTDNIVQGVFNIQDFAPDKSLTAIDNTNATVGYSIVSGWQYIITVDCDNDSITNVVPNDIMYSGIKTGSWAWLNKDSPKTSVYDPVAKTIHLVSKYATSSSNDRISDELITW
jgi:Domain of unknown function (DUF1735)